MSGPPLQPEERQDHESLINGEGQTPISNAGPETKSSGKDPINTTHLDVPLATAFRNSSTETLSNLSIYSANNENERISGRLLSPTPATTDPYLSSKPQSWRKSVQDFWIENKGCALVLLAQLFGALMAATTRLLETDGAHGKGMHPFQILFVRMTITVSCSSFYMWYARVPDAPWGKRPIRILLVMRGFGGFFGVFGFYYSLLYLPLAEATVLTFLAPILACWVCSFILHEPFTRTQQIAGFVSLLGVILIARPVSLFSALNSPSPSSQTPPTSTPPYANPALNGTSSKPAESHVSHASPVQHVYAVCFALLGVVGGATAITSIRWIGTRAHPLISVNYFSIWCTFVSTVCLIVIPSVNFRLPGNATEWTLLSVLGTTGFVMQFLNTAGLAYNPDAVRADANNRGSETSRENGEEATPLENVKTSGGSKATSMLYTNMLFALLFDRIIWGVSPSLISWAGSGLILGSTVWVALKKEEGKKRIREPVERRKNEEEVRGLMEGDDAGEGSASQGRELRGWTEVELRALR